MNQTQKDVMAKIVDMGVARGFSTDQINLAVKAAYIESSMGMAVGARPGTAHIGLYQYDPTTWATQQHSGSITDTNAQISAFYDDIAYYTGRYNALTPTARGNLSLNEYVYVKHHDGRSYSDFAHAPGLSIYQGTCFNPELHVDEGLGGANMSPMPGPGVHYWWSPAIQDRTGHVEVRSVQVNQPTDDGDGQS